METGLRIRSVGKPTAFIENEKIPREKRRAEFTEKYREKIKYWILWALMNETRITIEDYTQRVDGATEVLGAFLHGVKLAGERVGVDFEEIMRLCHIITSKQIGMSIDSFAFADVKPIRDGNDMPMPCFCEKDQLDKGFAFVVNLWRLLHSGYMHANNTKTKDYLSGDLYEAGLREADILEITESTGIEECAHFFYFMYKDDSIDHTHDLSTLDHGSTREETSGRKWKRHLGPPEWKIYYEKFDEIIKEYKSRK